MLPLFVPVFAQLVTLGVHDRTEGRYLYAEEKRYEASTRPGAELTFAWPRYRLSFGYAPSILITPLEREPRDVLVYHNLRLVTSYSYKHTTLTLGSSYSFGSVNFLVAGLQDAAAGTNNGRPTTTTPTPTTPTPTTPDPTQPAQPTQPGGTGAPTMTPSTLPQQATLDYRTVRYESWATSAAVSHQATRELNMGAIVTYTIAGALKKADRVDYPLTRGTLVTAYSNYTYSWTARDSFVTSLNAQEAISSYRAPDTMATQQGGNRATAVVLRETWNHIYNKHTSSSLGAGLSTTRNSQADGLIAYSVYPGFSAGVSYQDRLAKGNFGLSLLAYAAPALDPLRATVDPRVGFTGSMGWNRKRFSTALTGSAAVSTAPAGNDAGAFDSYQGGFVMGYSATDWLSVDCGARVANQVYQDVTVVPLSYSVFVGLTLGYDVVLLHAH